MNRNALALLLAVGIAALPSTAAAQKSPLWGDYFIVDPNKGHVQGDNLVHIEADSARQPKPPAAQPATRIPLKPRGVTLAMVVGDYQYQPAGNKWHTGKIIQTNGALRWVNSAGVSWSLKPDLQNKRLLTGGDNPYYAKYPNLREFQLIVSDRRVTGFNFGGVYKRVPTMSGMGGTAYSN